MELSGIKPTTRTATTPDDLSGLRRKTAARTKVDPTDFSGAAQAYRATKPLNTSMADAKPATQTKITPADLTGVRGKHANLSEHERLEQQARKLVSQTFFGTLMKQMRDSPFKSKLFDGGRGGEAFGEMYDQHLTERMSRGAGAHLVNAIVRRLEARAAAVRGQLSAPGKIAAPSASVAIPATPPLGNATAERKAA